jgi:hypothetical protein
VRTVEELDAALEDLSAEATAEPFMAELYRDGSGSLAIGLGREWTVLNYVPEGLDPPYLQARAPGNRKTSLWFRFRGEASEFPPEAALPVEPGRAALRHFFMTGELTTDLSWQEN